MSRAVDHIIEIDNANFEYTGGLYVNGWVIITSNTNAQLVISDVNKNWAIPLTTTTEVERTFNSPAFGAPTYIKNLKVDIWTNISKVIIYVDRFAED